MKNLLYTLLLFALPFVCAAGGPMIHSHNDYHQRVPLYQAYSQQVDVIEADVRLDPASGLLLVCHDPDEIPRALDIERQYLAPLAFLFAQNDGRPWRNSEQKLTLMIDLKTPLHPTIDTLIAKLERYPGVFDEQVNPYAVRVVISGSRPDPAGFDNYPPFIFFDGFFDVDYTPEQLARVGFMSDYFGNYSKWKGVGEMPAEDKRAVLREVEKSHWQGKPIRFWGAPDTPTAWETLRELGADIINTDRPEACRAYFRGN